MGIPDSHTAVVMLVVGRQHADEKLASGGYPQFRFPEEEIIVKQ